MTVTTIRKNTKKSGHSLPEKKRSRFPVVCTPASKTRLIFQIEIRKIEGGIAVFRVRPFDHILTRVSRGPLQHV